MPTLPNGQKMWIAYLGEIRRVSVVAKGTGGTVFKTGEKPRNPYVIYDEVDEEEFVMGLDELHHNPRDAQLAAAKMAKEHGMVMENPAPVTHVENPVTPPTGDDESEDDEDESEYDEEEEGDDDADDLEDDESDG